ARASQQHGGFSPGFSFSQGRGLRRKILRPAGLWPIQQDDIERSGLVGLEVLPALCFHAGDMDFKKGDELSGALRPNVENAQLLEVLCSSRWKGQRGRY